MLLEAGAKINQRDVHGRTAIFDAIERGNYFMVDLLLKLGADPESADDYGLTPMKRCYEDWGGNRISPNRDIVRLLRKAGAKPPARKRRKTKKEYEG